MQAYQFANYHVTDASCLLPAARLLADLARPDAASAGANGSPPPMRPYYQLIRVPGAKTEEFQLVIPFVPAGRPNMVGWMAASSDPADYGHVTMFRFPEGQNIEGPPQGSPG